MQIHSYYEQNKLHEINKSKIKPLQLATKLTRWKNDKTYKNKINEF